VAATSATADGLRQRPDHGCRLAGSSTPGTLKGVDAYNCATVAPGIWPALVTSKLTCTVPSADAELGPAVTLPYAKLV
jgi:hypothetical protein